MNALFRVLNVLFNGLAYLLNILFRTLGRLGRYWLNDMRGRRTAKGKLASFSIGMFAILCACSVPLALFGPDTSSTSARPVAQGEFEAAPSRREFARGAVQREQPVASTATSRPDPTATARPTSPPPPTRIPTATVPAPPVGQSERVANVRSAPRVADDTVIGKLCPGDSLEYVSMQQVGDELWFRVRVASIGADCDPQRASVGLEGWAAASVLAEPSYDVRRYADQVGITLPTAIPPTAVPTRAPAPQPVAPQQCDPSYPDFCLPPGIGDLNCPDIPYRRFTVVGIDPHGFDRDRDGIGCESN